MLTGHVIGTARNQRVPSLGFGLGVGFLRGNQLSGLTRYRNRQKNRGQSNLYGGINNQV